MDRRQFLQASLSATGGLVLLAHWPSVFAATDHPQNPQALGKLIEIDADGKILIHLFKQEMGQGATTGIAMLAAEELCADWQQVTLKHVNFSRQVENYTAKWGRFGTGGSTAIETEWQAMRTAGASAREMLKSAAAARWGLPVSELVCRDSRVIHPSSGKSLDYGELAAAAAAFPVPVDPPLKQRSQYTLIGQPKPGLGAREVVSGVMQYGLDVSLPGMLHATILRTPVVGAKLRSFDASSALAVAGIHTVFALDPMPFEKMFDKGIRGGIVIVGESTWACLKARNKVVANWDYGLNGSRDSADLYGELAATKASAEVRVSIGQGVQAPQGAAQVVTADFNMPFIAHGLMEPLSAIADFSDGEHLKICAGTQSPQHSAHHIAEDLGIPVENIEVQTYRMGGGYGRRYFCDFMLEAALISRQLKKPVKVTWTREDEIRFDGYHPLRIDTCRAGLDAQGNIDSWVHECVSTHEWGGAEMTFVYGFEHLHVTSKHHADSIVPWGSWRSVTPHLDGFVREIFVDELAHQARQDPLDYRIAQTQRAMPSAYHQHHKVDMQQLKQLQVACLKAVKKLSGWSQRHKQERALGVAVVAFHDRSLCAQVAEVEVTGQSYRVSKVYVVADCGLIVNPNLVTAQIESSILWGLTPVLYGGVDVVNGAVVQSNFHDMPLARMQDAPEIVIELHDFQQRPPCGVGEFAVVPVAPAVSNALFAATGKRLRNFPMRL